MGSPQPETTVSNEAVPTNTPVAVLTETASEGATSDTQLRVITLEAQVSDLTERLRQVESFLTRKYPYG